MHRAKNLGWVAAAAAMCGHSGIALSETPALDGKAANAFTLGFQDITGCQLLYEDCKGNREIVTLATPFGFRVFYEKLSEKSYDEFLNVGVSKPFGSARVSADRKEFVEGHLAGLAKDFVFDKWKIGNFTFTDAATVEISLAVGKITAGGQLSGSANAELNAGTYPLNSIALLNSVIPAVGETSQTFDWQGSTLSHGGCALQYSSGKLVTPAVTYKNGVVSASPSSLSALSASWSNCTVNIGGQAINIPGGMLSTPPVNVAGGSAAALDLTLPSSIQRNYAESVSGSAKTIFGEAHLAMAFNRSIISPNIIATLNPCAHADSQVWWGGNIGVAFGPSLEGSAANADACLGKPFIAKRGWAGFVGVNVIDTKIDFAWNEEVVEANSFAAQGNALLKGYVGQANNLLKGYAAQANGFLQNYGGQFNSAAAGTGQQINVPSINAPAIKSAPTITGPDILNALGIKNPLGVATWGMVGASDHIGRCTVALGASDPIYPRVRSWQLNGMVACRLD